MTDAPRRSREARLGQHRYGLVLGFAVASLGFALVAADGSVARGVALLLAGVTLAVGVVTSEAPARTRHGLAVAVVVLVVLGVILDAAGSSGPAVIFSVTTLLSGATIGVIAGGLVRLVFARGVVVQAVLGALAVYLLVGLTFAALIGAIAAVIDVPYFAGLGAGAAGMSDRAYFSFTVLTTTGFGDLTPAVGVGRLLAVLEMLIGQLYLVTVISLLVGNLGRRHRSEA